MSVPATDAPKQIWAFQITTASLQRLLPLRLESDIEIAESSDEMFWVRGVGLSSERYQILAAVCDSALFLVDEQHRLTPGRNTVPTGRLPVLNWICLSEFFSANPPTPRRIRDSQLRINVRLRRSEQTHEAAAMITSWDIFLEWGLTTSELRLKPLRFAVSGQRVLVIGRPLPPLPGKRYWEAERAYVPLGYEWYPAVDQRSLSHSLSLIFIQSHPENQHAIAEKVVFLWHEESEQIEPVQVDELRPVSRSTLRQTAIAMAETHELPEAADETGDWA